LRQKFSGLALNVVFCSFVSACNFYNGGSVMIILLFVQL